MNLNNGQTMENEFSYTKSYADYIGVNPYKNWQLDEIKQIINSVKGYENIDIEFVFYDSSNIRHQLWTCKVKLIDGEKCLLQYKFVIDGNDESNARVQAWNNVTTLLVRDIWLTAIDSFKNLSYAKQTN
jgi:hypothetical protein